MKARIKETGELIEVMQVYEKGESFYVRLDMLDTIEVRYHISELEFEGVETEGKFAQICLNGIKQDIDNNPDYWARLEHQYAGMAMQGLMSYVEQITPKKGRSFCDEIVDISAKVAHALVDKYKKEEK